MGERQPTFAPQGNNRRGGIHRDLGAYDSQQQRNLRVL